MCQSNNSMCSRGQHLHYQRYTKQLEENPYVPNNGVLISWMATTVVRNGETVFAITTTTKHMKATDEGHKEPSI